MADKTQQSAFYKTFLIFWVDGQLFAADVKAVLEVLRNENVSPIPRNYDFIQGIINFRGEVVTVVNTGQKLLMPERKEVEKEVIIVFDFIKDKQEVKLGAQADRVMKVMEVKTTDIHPVPDFGENYNPEFLDGTLKTDDGFALILRIEKIFSDKEVAVLQDNTEKQTHE